MTDMEEHGGEERDDDVVAAEYVLGALPAGERDVVARRVETDREFATLVSAWENRLSGMNESFGEAPPPARIWNGLEDRLFAGGVAATPARSGLMQSLSFWRGLSFASLAAAAALAAIVVLRDPPAPPAGEELVASLASPDSQSTFIALKLPDGTVRVSRTGAAAPAGSVYELWAIAGDAAPVSMGLIGDGDVTRTALPADLREVAVTLAVTIEPPGGAPGGVASGPIVAVGELKKI